ncbi:MAG: methionyl-tRNA formyltransferase [Bacteroidales bacterium]|nr:methionyl-tRNA formyltransferase [Bacteroidales bacterium]
MRKLDKFTLKAFIGPFVAILLIVVFILMMQFLWLYIDELVGKGLSFGVIMEFMMWGACTILPMALPLAVLLSSMMVIGQMGENKELMAIKAAGISLGRLIAPLIVASAIISIGAFFIGNDLVPKAYNEIFTLRDDITKTKGEIKIPPGTFYDGIEGYVLRVEGRNDETGMMYHVQVYDHTARRGNNSIIIADSALLKISKAKDYLTFSLFNGSNYQETNEMSYRDTSLALSRVDFSREELIIPLKNYSFEKSDSARFSDQAKSMRLDQLAEQKDSLDRFNAEAFDKHYARMRAENTFREYPQLDTAVRNQDLNMFASDDLWKWDSYDQVQAAYDRAASLGERLSGDVLTYNHDIYQSTFYLRRTDVELFKKFAQALACFLMFFIGAPIGAMIKKGGIGMSAIFSMLFFVIYWIVQITGEKMAKDGTWLAFHGVFSPAYILAPVGAFLTVKAVKDAELFNMDTVKAGWRKILSRISGFFRKPRIVYMGTPEFAVAPLDALLKRGYKVAAVVTVADKPSGRGLKMNQSAVKQYAVEHGLPVLQPVKLKDPEFLAQLAAFKADIFVVVAFRMLPEEVWRMPKLGTFNLHASLLPQYRGAAPINWAIINGEKRTGVTTFMIDKNIDTGGIILREECLIEDSDNAGTLHDKLMALGSNLVCDTAELIIQHNVELRVQRSFVQGSEELKPAPKLTRELCRIDWTKPSTDIRNLVRGLSPYPAAYTDLVSETGERVQLKVFDCSLSSRSGEGLKPGELASDGKSYLTVGTADGAVDITDLQLAGKKRMDVGAFLLGFRNPASWHCDEE